MASRATNGDSSDDDVYNGVDLISDSEDDEGALESKEETIITREEDRSVRNGSAGPTAVDDDDFFSDADLPDLGGAADLSTFFVNAIDSSTPPDPIDVALNEKRVHFVDDFVAVGDDSADASTCDEYGMGALYIPQDKLEPIFRKHVEDDLTDDEGVGEDDTRHASNADLATLDLLWGSPAENVVGDDYQAFSTTLDSREIDDGETTDEEPPPPESMTSTRSVLRRRTDPPVQATTEHVRRSATAKNARRPWLASWIADPSKPMAVVDHTGKIIVLPALRPNIGSSGGVGTAAPPSRHLSEHADWSGQALMSPTLSSGANTMQKLFNETAVAAPPPQPSNHFQPAATASSFPGVGTDTACRGLLSDEEDEFLMMMDTIVDLEQHASDTDESANDSRPGFSSAEEATPSKAAIDSPGRKRRLTSGGDCADATDSDPQPARKRIKSF